MWIQLETQAYLVNRRNRSTSYFSDIAMTANTRPTMLVSRPQRIKVTSETTSAPITLPCPASISGEVARYGGTYGRCCGAGCCGPWPGPGGKGRWAPVG